jgi:hypothetical protein
MNGSGATMQAERLRVSVRMRWSFIFPNLRNPSSRRVILTTEICAVKLQSVGQNICIVAVYRAPSWNSL